MKTKEEIRKGIKSLFLNINREELWKKNESIYKEIITYIHSKKIKHICIYESMNDEVDTNKLISTLREFWYKVYTPQIISETEMILIDEEYDIYEKEIDLFLIPGRAFTIDWKRLWRGKGYYDRFLEKNIYKKSPKVWICFDFQIIKEIPTKKHDKDMNTVIFCKNVENILI